MKFKAYPKYKASGVEWLGDVPEGWSVVPFKREIERNDGGAWGDEPDTDAGTLTVVLRSTEQTADGRWKINDPAVRRLSDNELAGSLLEEGDLVVTKSSGSSLHIGKTTLVSAEVAKLRCCYSNFMQRIRVRRSSVPTFLWYVMNNDISRSQFDLLSNSTTGLANLNSTMIGELLISIPSADEQSKIATFLDRETAKIDTLIAKQEKLIDLLKEKRQAVISHAVTKGLDSTAPMKPSGVEWLGDVPKHWKKIQLGRLCKKVADGPHFSPSYVDDGVMFISARNIKLDGWEMDDAKFISEQDCIEFDKRVVPEIGDVLYTKGGTTGIARVVDFEDRFQVWVHVAVLKIEKRLAVPYFIAYALNSIGCHEQAQLHTRGATNQDLGLTRMIKIWMALPDLLEQQAVVDYLDIATTKIDTLIGKAQQAIALQKEHRTALISAAVTGKIDVRVAAVQTKKSA